jgi:protein SCO1/2
MLQFLSKSKLNTAPKTICVFLLIAFSFSLLASNSLAQAVPHYNSPLYSPKGYEDDVRSAGTINGIPQILKKVGIEQKLGEQLPLDTKFFDENNQEVALGQYFGKKPVIIALVYYECPMLCNEVLNGLVGSLKPLTFDAGDEFEVVVISFDAKEKPELAKAKKESYLARYNRPNAEKGWHFLTGTQDSIDQITQAVGFNYQWDEQSKQFAHAGGIQIATPEGKLSHYFYGVEYAPKEIRLALIEAADKKIGNPVDSLMLYCYHYDPATGKYGLVIMNALRVAGVATLLGMAALLLILMRYKNGKVTIRKTI